MLQYTDVGYTVLLITYFLEHVNRIKTYSIVIFYVVISHSAFFCSSSSLYSAAHPFVMRPYTQAATVRGENGDEERRATYSSRKKLTPEFLVILLVP